MGWFTVLAYAMTAVLAAWAARRVNRERLVQGGPRVRTVWLGVAVLLSFLCVNKQLDLQSLLTDIGRALSKSQGWYGERRTFQKGLVFGALGFAGTFAVWFTYKFRRFWLSHGLLLTGLFSLLTFILVQAISFHHVDQFLGTRLAGVKVRWFLELVGIFLVALAAAREIRDCGKTGPDEDGRRSLPA